MTIHGVHGDHDVREQTSPGRRRSLVTLLVLILLLAGLAVGTVVGARALLGDVFTGPEDFPGPGSGEVLIEVRAGESLTDIGSTLEDAGVVASVDAFSDAADADPLALSIQPGSYSLLLAMPAADAVARLLDPAARIEARVTVREGLRVDQTIDALVEGTGIPREDFAAALADLPALGAPDWVTSPEGLLFPATYTVQPGATAGEVLRQMVTRFVQAIETTALAPGAGQYSAAQLLVMASIIQAEATPDYMGKVSRVLHNRLAEGRLLQLDSTVSYANGSFEVTTTQEQRALQSPYNTYLFPGLPPGPISAPGEAAMAAAVSPEAGPWLFFVTVNPDTGETKFAVTDAEHAVNVEEFRAWLNGGG